MDNDEVLDDIDKRVNDIVNRIVVIETDSKHNASTRRVIWSIAGSVIIAAFTAVAGYSRLMEKIENINMTEFEGHIGTLLTVAADHGTALLHVRSEISEIRGVHTTFNDQMFQLRTQIDDRTAKRFYKSDGSRLEARILRIENRIFK